MLRVYFFFFFTEHQLEGGWAAYLLQSHLPIPYTEGCLVCFHQAPFWGTRQPDQMLFSLLVPPSLPTSRVLAGSRQGSSAEKVGGGPSHPSLLCKAWHHSQSWPGSCLCQCVITLPMSLALDAIHPLFPRYWPCLREGVGSCGEAGLCKATRAHGPTKLSPNSCLLVLASTLSPGCKETKS